MSWLGCKAGVEGILQTTEITGYSITLLHQRIVVGLSGEVRHLPFLEKRVAEAKKLGFSAAIGPKVRSGKKPALLTEVPDVRSALNTFLEKD